jgi:HSP20 family molecular chaperone IbpA
MNTQTQDVQQQSARDVTAERRGSRQELAMRPPVDVYETAEGITLHADMPGVSKDRLELRIDGNTLQLEGKIEFPMGANLEARHADVRSTLYRCSFALSNELDTARVEANLKDGVLTVRIPKRAELRPRRIEVRTA